MEAMEMALSQKEIDKIQALPEEKLNIVIDLVDQLSVNPIDVFDKLREDAKASDLKEEDVDDFVFNIRKERYVSRG